MGKLFLVLGPESSGNNLASLLLKTMGCYWEEPQKLDLFLKGKMDFKNITYNPNVVLRRSVPYGNEWANPAVIGNFFKEQGYKMYTIVLQREWMATMLSNYYHRSLTVEEAWETLVKAEKHIAQYLYGSVLDPFYVLNTSSLMKDPEPVIKGLELFTGLKWPGDIEYGNIVHDSDIGRHQLLLDRGFESIDRGVHKKYMGKPRSVVKR